MKDQVYLTPQQQSFLHTVVRDLQRMYRNRGCCGEKITWEENYHAMTYAELVEYWRTAYPKKKVPIGCEP